MRKLLASAAAFILSATLSFATPQHDQGDRRDDDERHDHGRHEGWEKHRDRDRDDHRHWDYDHDRVRPGRAYPFGRYAYVRHSFQTVSFDFHTRRVILADRSAWVVAPYDLDRCRDWGWGRDTIYVYDDDTHPGWYLLFNAQMGRYVHVEYFGVH